MDEKRKSALKLIEEWMKEEIANEEKFNEKNEQQGESNERNDEKRGN